MGIIIAVIIYEILVIGGCGYYLHKKEKKEMALNKAEAFIVSNRDMSTPLVGVTLGLAILGSVHIFGFPELAWGVGALAAWFPLANVFVLCFACYASGRWARRFKVATVPELIYLIYDSKFLRVICSCIMAIFVFGILTLEAQGLGILFSSLTKGAVSIRLGLVIGGVCGIFYVILAGMKQIGWVNMFNLVIAYIGLILALIFISMQLPGGWEAVGKYYHDTNQTQMLSIFGTPDMFIAFAVSLSIAVMFSSSISQMSLQTCMSAKNERSIIKSVGIALPVNFFFGIITIGLGLASRAMYETNAMPQVLAGLEAPAKTATIQMMTSLLPPWLLAILLAGFLGAILSTVAVTSMGVSTMFVMDIYKPLRKPNADPKSLEKYTKIGIAVVTALAVASAWGLPPIGDGAIWLCAFIAPVFWNLIFGLFWKRSKAAAAATFIAVWVLFLVWTFTPLPAALNMAGVSIAYVTVVVSIVLGAILNLILPGKKGYFRENSVSKDKVVA